MVTNTEAATVWTFRMSAVDATTCSETVHIRKVSNISTSSDATATSASTTRTLNTTLSADTDVRDLTTASVDKGVFNGGQLDKTRFETIPHQKLLTSAAVATTGASDLKCKINHGSTNASTNAIFCDTTTESTNPHSAGKVPLKETSMALTLYQEAQTAAPGAATSITNQQSDDDQNDVSLAETAQTLNRSSALDTDGLRRSVKARTDADEKSRLGRLLRKPMAYKGHVFQPGKTIRIAHKMSKNHAVAKWVRGHGTGIRKGEAVKDMEVARR
ncbi:hypothetical protein W97_02265 [Coniosporium apollinis CBS 100218]|uniref:Uncharacterized protein n=1 Tax=Coniosporium apollinis (strain CBS 100218) TaxID=1168221 RepID=R7YME5_CONA1|nr:uncharacterized protein W97_02265 [Coniosporium apollinis CBS 100218]EON63038.1 hypothetical protein W97_02265 [Coniosporium apollinis CBS 100218]